MRRPDARAALCLPLLVLAAVPLSAVPAGAEPGSATRTVPDCVGLPWEAAQALASTSGFPLERRDAPEGAAGRVVDQRPGGLSEREPGTPLVLHVGTGAPLPAAPLPGATPPAAPLPEVTAPPVPSVPPAVVPPAALPPTGPLPPPAVRPARGPPPAPGRGPAPTPTPPPPPPGPPAPGKPTPPAATAVDLSTLPDEPQQGTQGPPVPTLLGLRREQLKPLVGPWVLVIGITLTTPEADGRVLEQFPAPGTPLSQGGWISLVLGATRAPAPDQRQVPDVLGQGLDAAVATLERAGFEVRLSAEASPDAQRALVVRQFPQRHCFIRPGQPVKLVIGRGGAAPAPR